MWWPGAVALLGGLALAWLALVAALFLAGRRQDDPTTLRDVLRLLPDVVGLLRGLAADRALPRGVRVRLVLLALRSVARAAGPEALDRHWRGAPEGLRALKRLAGIPV